MTYTYRCIGKGTTDSNGVAHITHDCSGNALSDDGYKGVGAGLMDFIASTDAPADISDGSFQSEPFPLLDCLFLMGNWINISSRLTPTTNSDGSISLTNSSGSPGFYLANKDNTGSSYADANDWSIGTCIEFDIVSFTGACEVRLYDYTNSISSNKSFTNLGITGNNHVKITVDGNGAVTYVVDDGNPITATTQTNLFGTGLVVPNEASCTFKNFKIYPI